MLRFQQEKNVIPGSESMVSSYNKIMGEFGLDPQKEQEDAQRKVLEDFMQKARAGQTQGKGKFAKKFAPTAHGFGEYIASDAAYNLHQGPGGKRHDEQTAKGMGKLLAGIGGGNM